MLSFFSNNYINDSELHDWFWFSIVIVVVVAIEIVVIVGRKPIEGGLRVRGTTLLAAFIWV